MHKDRKNGSNLPAERQGVLCLTCEEWHAQEG